MRAPLHFDRVAPGGITLPFVIAAPFFGALAALLLFVAGGDVLVTRWHPALIGALHVYTIGFLLFVMVGASLQIGPVMTARPALQNERLARSLRFALGGGALLLGCGLFHSLRVLLVPAFFLLAFALPLWIGIAIRGTGATRTSRDLVIALAGLAIGISIGLRLAFGHAFPVFGLPRHLTDLHASWMLLGGLSPLVMGVGVVVIPMFQHTQPLPGLVRALPAIAFAGMLLETLPWVSHAGTAISMAALLAFAMLVLFAQATRRSAGSDATVRLFRLAMLCAIGGVLAWVGAVLFPGAGPRLQWLGGVLLVAGFGGSAVQGMSLKIVPFLVRLRLQRTLWQHARPALGLPGLEDLLSRREARWLPMLQAAAIAGLALAALTHNGAIHLLSVTLLGAAQLHLGGLLLLATARGARASGEIANAPATDKTFKESTT